MMKALTTCYFEGYFHLSPSYPMLSPRLEDLFKNHNKNPKLDMTVNSKASLVTMLTIEYGCMIHNEKKSHTATS